MNVDETPDDLLGFAVACVISFFLGCCVTLLCRP